MGSKRNRREAMGDEELADIYVIGTDGEEVACNKAFLAAQSRVFKRMFIRDFREQTSDRFNLDYCSLVITMIMKYCYSGKVDMDLIIRTGTNDGSYDERPLKEQASLLLEVRAAVKHFEIDELILEIEKKIGDLVFDGEQCRYVCAMLSELMIRSEDKGPFWCALLEFAVANPMGCFFWTRARESEYHPHPVVLARALERVLNTNIKDTVVVVRCLQAWFARSKDVNNDSFSGIDTQPLIDIARRVDLKQLTINQLSKTKPSSIFPMEQIFEAFVHHGNNRSQNNQGSRRVEYTRRYHATGAGMECLNGSYTCFSGPSSCRVLYKNGVYEGETCLFVFHYKSTEHKWLLSMTTEAYDVLNARQHLLDVDCQVHLYESSTSEPAKIPFNGWTSLHGTDPPPMVARIFRYEAVAQPFWEERNERLPNLEANHRRQRLRDLEQRMLENHEGPMNRVRRLRRLEEMIGVGRNYDDNEEEGAVRNGRVMEQQNRIRQLRQELDDNDNDGDEDNDRDMVIPNDGRAVDLGVPNQLLGDERRRQIERRRRLYLIRRIMGVGENPPVYPALRGWADPFQDANDEDGSDEDRDNDDPPLAPPPEEHIVQPHVAPVNAFVFSDDDDGDDDIQILAPRPNVQPDVAPVNAFVFSDDDDDDDDDNIQVLAPRPNV
ncbi:MAG: hypothetical protein SGBAC_005538 [Bacillariaceae sp.]